MSDFILSAFADEAADSLNDQIIALKRNEIAHIEIRNVDGKCVIDLSESELLTVRKCLDHASITVSAIGSPIGKYNIDQPFEPHIERFSDTIKAAHILGTKRIRMFSFFIPVDSNAAIYRNEVLHRLEILTDIAEKNDVWCCHENEKDIYGDIVERCIDLHIANNRLKGIFDPANYIQCNNVPAEILPKIIEYIDYLHIKDALLSDGSVVPAGKGDGEIATLINLFYKPNVTQFLTVEPHLAVFSGLNNLQDEQIKHKYTYSSQAEAFDAAVSGIKVILNNGGYTYE